MRKYFVYVISFSIVVIYITTLTTYLCNAQSSQQLVNIVAFNPYSMRVELEVKCDHNYKTNKFEFHKVFIVPKKGKVEVSVPNHFKNCQIWPKVKFF